MKRAVLLGLLFAPVGARAADVSLEEFTFKDAPTFAGKTRKESAEFLNKTVRSVLAKKLEAAGHRLVEADQNPVATFKIELKKFRQINRTPSEILNTPNKPASETTVQVKFEFRTPLRIESADKLDGKFGGGFFGTTDRWELSGNPEDKATMVNLVAKKRAEAIALAIWDAINKPLQTAIQRGSLP